MGAALSDAAGDAARVSGGDGRPVLDHTPVPGGGSVLRLSRPGVGGPPLVARLPRPAPRRVRRGRLPVVYAADVCCALAAFFWAGLAGLVVEQAGAAILVRVYHSLVGIHFVRQAKWLAVQDSWKPVRSVALSLKTRRLRDYTNL